MFFALGDTGWHLNSAVAAEGTFGGRAEPVCQLPDDQCFSMLILFVGLHFKPKALLLELLEVNRQIYTFVYLRTGLGGDSLPDGEQLDD